MKNQEQQKNNLTIFSSLISLGALIVLYKTAIPIIYNLFKSDLLASDLEGFAFTMILLLLTIIVVILIKNSISNIK